ncbi:hypothetical protein [Microbispora sp. GKU 823]|uniref:hypothetical protein n=1 Tax=Microbispora sp. GKU 823 TaxID=1652100 RepID=UPI001C4E26C7|nr:hypothetical protein [Microbispora sp. GKU 823]
MAVFTDADLDRFVTEGFLKVEEAFPRETGDRIRDLLWRQIGLSPRPAGRLDAAGGVGRPPTRRGGARSGRRCAARA